MGDAFPISGSIDPASFPFLLANLHRHNATGSLKVDGADYQKALYFRSGRILFGSSNDPRDQLGAILIESGRLTPEQLEAASATVGPGLPLAKVLADGGLVSQRDLGEAARAKVESILADLLATPAGSFEFEDDVLPKGAIDLKLVTPRLFVAAVQRVPDRRFSEHHLGGSNAVLKFSPPPEAAEWLADLGRLPSLLDGRRTLREAAAQAGLDGTKAGQIACALLFLGLAERASSNAPMFEAIDGDGDLDLAQTARLALDTGTAPIPAAAPPPAPAHVEEPPATDIPFFVADDSDDSFSPPAFALDSSPFQLSSEPEPEPEPQPTVILPLPEDDDDAPTASVPPPAPRGAAPAAPPEVPTAAPVPPAVEPPAAPPPAEPARPAPARGGRADLPLIPPPARHPSPARAPAPPEEPEPTLQRPLSVRPSKEDLEALDTLLNARSIETPLEGSTSTPPARKPAAFDPSFGRSPAPRGRKVDAAPSRRPGRAAAVVAGVLALGAVGAGGWYLWSDGAAAPPAASPSPAARKSTSVPLAVDAGGGAPPTVVPLPATPAATPPPAVTAQAPTPPPTPTPAAGQPAAGADPRALLGRGDLSGAGRGFVSILKQSPRGTYSIQLLVACAPETVTKAVANAGAPELFIVPVQYQGRACYRVCWGLFDGSARAESARASLPPYFRQGGARPKVVAAAELLP